MASLLYDPVDLLTLDAQIATYASSERELLYQHLQHVRPRGLLLLDMGYPRLGLFFLLKAKKIDFCARMKGDWWLAVKEFRDSGKKESVVDSYCRRRIGNAEVPSENTSSEDYLPVGASRTEQCGKEVLCTSLNDSNRYSHEDMGELYHVGWNIE